MARVEGAGIARADRIADPIDADLRIEADGRPPYQIGFFLHAGLVHHLAGGEVVGAVQHHVGIAGQFTQQLGIRASGQGADLRIAVDLLQRRAHGFGLGLTDAGLGMGDLALQIGQVHLIVVHQREAAYAGAGQVHGSGRAQAACANDDGVRSQQALLTLHIDFLEQQVAGIAQELGVVHREADRTGERGRS